MPKQNKYKNRFKSVGSSSLAPGQLSQVQPQAQASLAPGQSSQAQASLAFREVSTGSTSGSRFILSSRYSIFHHLMESLHNPPFHLHLMHRSLLNIKMTKMIVIGLSML